MVKIDLITGFLGSGKTTFIKKYAEYLINKGENICILENDFGAINVDMMLLSDLPQDKCELEMVSGGCDKDCHKRRFKTKLIAMGMCGYTRVIVEPSGIFDTDEFFDTLREEPLDKWYEIGSVITILDPASLSDYKEENSSYLIASEAANAGVIIFSKLNSAVSDITPVIAKINNFLSDISCQRVISENDVIAIPWSSLSDSDFEFIKNAGYTQASYVKKQNIEEAAYDSLFFMNKIFTKESLINIKNDLFENNKTGNIIRIKGFYKDNTTWYEFNATKNELSINPIPEGQDVIIVIGSELNRELIDNIFNE